MTRWRVTDRATGEAREVDLDLAPSPSAGSDPGDGRILSERLDRGGLEVVVDGWRFEFSLEDARLAELRVRASSRSGRTIDDGPTEVRAIIPGRVVTVAVVPGDPVAAGAKLLSVEAMKMENEVRAPRDGHVARVLVAPGETVELGDVLVELT